MGAEARIGRGTAYNSPLGSIDAAGAVRSLLGFGRKCAVDLLSLILQGFKPRRWRFCQLQIQHSSALRGVGSKTKREQARVSF